ncbi:reverse transcriptase domain-containing protein [Tanacetum coccineum]|uniref:Reverse transcriptase domain-containing protein n=1 Tax=Tanacetum coccineum TaxID=301880 RepID=A0ABQ5EUZ7_9ASTR
MTNGREITLPLGFSKPPHIPNINTNERPPVTTTAFATTTPGNTSFAYRATTLTDPTPMISPIFIEANYEILKSLLKDRRRQIRNEDLQTKLEYFSEDYEEEREMEPRPEQTREVTPPIRMRSTRVRRQRETVVGFKEVWNREVSRTRKNTEGNRPSKARVGKNGRREMDLPPFLAAYLTGNPSVRGTSVYPPQGGYIPQTFLNGLFANPTGSVIPFVCWIEDYPLPDGLKIPSHVGSYNGKGDPNNFLHLFEGAIYMQKWLMPVACHMQSSNHTLASKRGSRRRTWQFTTSNKEKTRVSELSPLDLPSTYKGLMEKTYTWIEAREVATKGALNDRRDNFKRKGSQKLRAASSYVGKQAITRHVQSVQLSHLVKGIKKEMEKTSDSQRGEKKEKITTPAKAPILMINQEEACIRNSISKSPTLEGNEIAFPQIRCKEKQRTSLVNTKGVLGFTDAEEKITVNSKYPEQIVTIEKQLLEHFKESVTGRAPVEYSFRYECGHKSPLQIRNDMTGIPRTLTFDGKPFNTEHKLNEYSHIKPIKQKRRSIGPDRSTATYINKAYPKDCYPLPEIGWKVESLAGFHLKCFLDAYKGYHQIQMAEEDEDKTVFFVGEGVYCYRKMPFGLKNAGATYQRLVDQVFNDQIGRNLEAYVDDMVIKSSSEEDMLTDIKETFQSANKWRSSNDVSRSFDIKHKRNFIREKGRRTARRLRRYFQAHTTAILTNSPIKQALTKPKKSGHVAKWAIELGGHDIVFRARGRKTDTKLEETKPSCEWKLFTDRASSFDGSGAGLMLIDPEGKEYTYALRFEFETTNNEAEYEELLAGLRIAQEMEIINLVIFVDSQLLNKKVDALSKLALMTFEHLTKEVLVEVLARRSIEEKEVLQVETKEDESWMTPIHKYLLSGLLPEDSKESRKIRIKAPQYKLIRGSLYKKSFYTPWLRCIAPPKTDDVIKETHEDS